MHQHFILLSLNHILQQIALGGFSIVSSYQAGMLMSSSLVLINKHRDVMKEETSGG